MSARASRPERPLILVFCAHYLPGYKAGGPVRTLAHMVDQLSDQFNFYIITADRDLGDRSPYDGVTRDAWSQVGSARVYYRSRGLAGWIRTISAVMGTRPSIIYLNSFFGLDSSVLPLVFSRIGLMPRAPVIVAPRGEFSPSALTIKAAKKRCFLFAVRSIGFYRDVIFQASSKIEMADTLAALGGVSVGVAGDLTGTSRHPLPSPTSANERPLRAVFLSRISPMKNLVGAIKILRDVRIPISLDIYGTVEDSAYWDLCVREASNLPPNVTLTYKHPVHPDEVETTLAQYDFLFLPTLGENFGHVIRESLSAGVPVLISDRTQWRGLAARQVGADLDLTSAQPFVDWIHSFAKLDAPDRSTMAAAARQLGDNSEFASQQSAANIALFHNVIDGRPVDGSRPKILVFLAHYLPGYKAGGPIRTIANMVSQLGDEFQFFVVAADRDLGDASGYRGIQTDRWLDIDGQQVFYRSPGFSSWLKLIASLRKTSFKAVYINSFFDLASSILPLFAARLGLINSTPILLAPRGEFSKGALAIKGLKKRAFIAISRAVNLHSKVIFQASSDQESVDIGRVFGAGRVLVASNLAGVNKFERIPHHHCTKILKVVFLSRISPMKNLLGAIKAMSLVTSKVQFDICGTTEDSEYWRLCQQALDGLPRNIHVRVLGPTTPELVRSRLSGYDLFFLPTLGENYGHVIQEALSSGLPVLISDRTPWRDLEDRGVGADLPVDSPYGFASWIDRFAKLSGVERQAMRDAAYELGNDPQAAAERRQALSELLWRLTARDF